MIADPLELLAFIVVMIMLCAWRFNGFPCWFVGRTECCRPYVVVNFEGVNACRRSICWVCPVRLAGGEVLLSIEMILVVSVLSLCR